jgi:tight adherence protein B
VKALALPSQLVWPALFVAVFVACFATAYAVAAGETVVSKVVGRYVASLNSEFGVLFLPEQGERVVHVQAACLLTLPVAACFIEIPYWWTLWAAVALAPTVVLRQKRKRRVELLEQQVDGFVLAYANSLKTVANPAAALAATIPLLQEPTRQEMECIVKELRVGSSLEDAIVAMSTRVKSRWLDTGFSAVLIGLRVGGNLPTVLERTAGTIREMRRLLGVVRTKTGEGRAQLQALAVAPVAVVFLFDQVRPGFFAPLQGSFTGQLLVGVAAFLWLTSLLLARKVLAVDV